MRIHGFRWSPYVLKVEVALGLAGVPFTSVDVPFARREALVAITGGYIQVPVAELDDGKVIVDSRAICEHVVATGPHEKNETLVPRGLEAAVWAYADWADAILEDVCFRFASPLVRKRFATAEERALYTFVKERKFGVGCVDQWARDEATLAAKAKTLLAPTLATLSRAPFVLGETPTLADAALYGELAMLWYADPKIVPRLGESLAAFMERVEKVSGVRRA